MAAAAYYDAVQKLYIAYYGRPADPLGLQYWSNEIEKAGGSMRLQSLPTFCLTVTVPLRGEGAL